MLSPHTESTERTWGASDITAFYRLATVKSCNHQRPADPSRSGDTTLSGQPNSERGVQHNLRFHTGAPLTADLATACFAVLGNELTEVQLATCPPGNELTRAVCHGHYSGGQPESGDAFALTRPRY